MEILAKKNQKPRKKNSAKTASFFLRTVFLFFAKCLLGKLKVIFRAKKEIPSSATFSFRKLAKKKKNSAKTASFFLRTVNLFLKNLFKKVCTFFRRARFAVRFYARTFCCTFCIKNKDSSKAVFETSKTGFSSFDQRLRIIQ